MTHSKRLGTNQGGYTEGHGGETAPQKLAVYETKLAKICQPKIQKIALCRVRPPRLKYVQPALVYKARHLYPIKSRIYNLVA